MPYTPGRLFSDRYGHLMAEAALREPAARPGYRVGGDGATISERLLQCIWFDQLVKPDRLCTADGRRVRVHAPGFWNFEAGPDFQRAEIQFDDAAPVQGDVEVHFNSGDWTGHGHGLDPAYNDTILHVVFSPPRTPGDIRTAAGAPIAEVAIADALVDDLDALRAQLDTDEYPYASVLNVGACARDGLTQSSDAYWKLIGLAGEARLLLKARRADALHADADEMCWAMVMRGLGYKPFADGFLALAERAPYARLREVALAEPDATPFALTAALFGLAGLLSEVGADALPGDAARTRATQLRALWAKHRDRFASAPMSAATWRAGSLRPANRAPRRMVAAAHYVHQSGPDGLVASLRRIVESAQPARAAWLALEAWLLVEGDDFWRHRAHLEGKPWSRPYSLVGPDRARVLVIDAVVPTLLAVARRQNDARLEARLHELISAGPAQSPNSKIKLALYRMQGQPDAWPREQRTALHGQGLLHVLQEWCLERPTCEGCGVWRLLADRLYQPGDEKGPSTC